MNSLLQDTHYALRQLRRAPGFTLAMVTTLSIGIGLNTTIFTVVDSVLLRPLGYRDASRIVALRTKLAERDLPFNKVGGYDYVDLARDVKGLDATAYYSGAGPDGIEVNGTALYLPVVSVSPKFGLILGIEPVAGRLFHPDDQAGNDTLVSAAFAREHFGSAERALGQTVRYNSDLHPIVGVLPDGFSFPGKTEVWFETTPSPAPAWSARTAYNQSAIGRRRSGVTPAQLNAELAIFSSRLQQSFPEDRGKTIEAVSLQEQIVGHIRPTLHLLMAAVAIVLLIVSVNLAHLQLVRSMRQLRSTTVRAALGASRSALAWHALIEVALLAGAGLCGALIVAVPALRLLLRLAPSELPRLAEVHLNATVLLFSSAVSLAVMLATAALPVWRSWHLNAALALKQDSARVTESRAALRVRNSFVVVEVALTLMLSVGAMMLTRQLLAQSRVDLGFPAESLVELDTHIVSSDAPLADPAPDSTPQLLATYERAAQARRTANLARVDSALRVVAETPGVQAATAIEGAPIGYSPANVSYAVRGRQVFAPGVEKLPDAFVHPATPDLFATLRLAPLRGRLFTATDRFDTTLVAVINKTLADQIFPNQDPIGQQIACGLDDPTGPWWTIVGVVPDIHDSSPSDPPYPTFFVPLAQHPSRTYNLQIVARTASDPATMVDTLRRRLQQAHPEIAFQGATMRENIGLTQQAEHFRTALLSGFAGVSILLAAVGMYSVTAYSVAQRRFEFALRLALGAGRPQVLALVLRNALAVAAVGVALGVLLSLSATRLIAGMVGKLPVFDAAAYALAAALVLLLALLATLIPAAAAAVVDPMHILRTE